VAPARFLDRRVAPWYRNSDQAAATAPQTRRKSQRGETMPKSPETDGFQLVIDALKLNGIDTIFGLPGISDHRPHAQDAGRRNARDRFRHGRARVCRVHRRLHDAEAGRLPHVSAPGFLTD